MAEGGPEVRTAPPPPAWPEATRKICTNPARKATGMWGGPVEVLFVSFGIQCMHSAYESAYTPILHSDGRSGRQRLPTVDTRDGV